LNVETSENYSLYYMTDAHLTSYLISYYLNKVH